MSVSLYLMSTSLLWQLTIHHAALVLGPAFYLRLDHEEVFASERNNRITCVGRTRYRSHEVYVILRVGTDHPRYRFILDPSTGHTWYITYRLCSSTRSTYAMQGTYRLNEIQILFLRGAGYNDSVRTS